MMSEPFFLAFDLPVGGKGVADYTWKHLTVGRPISISAVAVMIEYPTSLETRTATVTITQVKKSMADFLSAGGAVIRDSDLDVTATNSGDILEGCRCVPPIEESCDDCPQQDHIAIGPIEVSLFQLKLTLETFKPDLAQKVTGKLAVMYDSI